MSQNANKRLRLTRPFLEHICCDVTDDILSDQRVLDYSDDYSALIPLAKQLRPISDIFLL